VSQPSEARITISFSESLFCSDRHARRANCDQYHPQELTASSKCSAVLGNYTFLTLTSEEFETNVFAEGTIFRRFSNTLQNNGDEVRTAQVTACASQFPANASFECFRRDLFL